MLKTREFLRCALLLSLVYPSSHAGSPAGNAAAVKSRLEDLAAKGEFVGQVLLERDGTVLLDGAFGLADVKAQPPQAASPETLYYIGSLAKMFTSTVVLQLDAEGKLKLDDPISRHLDGVPADKAAITITHLLTHSSGLIANHPDPLTKLDREQFLTWALATNLASKPGEKQSYSNVGFSTLAAVIERAGGEPFRVAVRRRIFDPAGMKDTYFLDDSTLDRPRLARGGGPNLAEFKVDGDPFGYRGTWLRMGPGGIVSNARDLLKWEQAIRGGKVISVKQYALATSPSAVSDAWGFGWRLSKTTRGTPLHFHDGGFPGFNAGFARFPKENAVVILLCNRDELAGANIRWIVADFFKQ